MAKMTLLEIVQSILNSMKSDEVNSISDTEESLTIAHTAQIVYFEMLGRRDWPHLFKFTTLNSVGDSSRPTHLNTPNNMARMDWLKYNCKEIGATNNNYKTIKYLYPDEFLEKTNKRNLDNSNVIEITDFDGAKFQILNDRQPTYYTSFDDKYVVMDSYNATIESTLQGSNTQTRIYEIPIWSATDNFTPDLPAESFPAFLSEVKSVAFYELEGEMNEKAEQQSVRQQKRLSLNGWSVNGGIRFPDYGRSRGRVTSGTLFNKDQRD